MPGRPGGTARPNRCHVGICLARPLGNRLLPHPSLPLPGRGGAREGLTRTLAFLVCSWTRVRTAASGLTNSVRIGRPGMRPVQSPTVPAVSSAHFHYQTRLRLHRPYFPFHPPTLVSLVRLPRFDLFIGTIFRWHRPFRVKTPRSFQVRLKFLFPGEAPAPGEPVGIWEGNETEGRGR